jgi:hypothetical protein
MDDLPFAKRPPRIRSCPAPSPHKPFDPVIFHSPVNKQVLVDRGYQQGNLRQVVMKAESRYVDGRVDQVDRNRMNMFDQEGEPLPQLTQTTAPLPYRATKHGMTPYSYSTYWLSHPPEGSSLAPSRSETWKTSFLAAPFTTLDHQLRAAHVQSRYSALRYHDTFLRTKAEQMDEAARIGHERALQNLRDQEKVYNDALQARRRIKQRKMWPFEEMCLPR